jgi:Glycosyltransferase
MYYNFNQEPGKTLRKKEIIIDFTPKISIITPYYNESKYFEQTYNSVMNQTFPWFEWIIVDYGSNIIEREYINSLKDCDERIKILKCESKIMASVIKDAIKASKADIIVTLSGGDLIIPTYLEYVFFGLYFNSDSILCYTDSIYFNQNQKIYVKEFSFETKGEKLLTHTAAIRKNNLLEIDAFDKFINNDYFDWKLWLALFSKNNKPVYLKKVGLWCRKRDVKIENLKEYNKEIDTFAKEIKRLITPIEYNSTVLNQYKKPSKFQWIDKVNKKHDKIRIMLIIPWMELGGADLFNLNIVRLLNKDKYDISIITTLQAENSWHGKFEEFTLDIHELPTFLKIENFASFINYHIISREVDIVFLSNSYYGYYLLPWLRKEFPDLLIIDYVHMEEWYWRNGGYARTSGVLKGIIDKTYVCNNCTRDVLIQEFNRESKSVQTLYIGVDHDKYNENNVQYGLIRKKLNIDLKRPIILFPCRIHPQKRPFLLIEIANMLKKKMPNIAFLVVGDGPQLDEMKQITNELNLNETIYYEGRQNDMLPYYKDSTLTLICSLKEGIALTAYESLSMGRPVITSNVGGQAELIDNSVGKVVPLLQDEASELDIRNFSNQEIELYVNAVIEILDNKENYNKMCKQCRARIENNFSLNKMIECFESEMNYLLNDNGIKFNHNKIYQNLKNLDNLIDDYLTLFGEIQSYENFYKYSYNADTKSELVRIANSNLGRKLINLLIRFKISKLFQ